MNFESLLHPATLLFIIGFTFGLISPQLRHRRKMMMSKFLGDIFIGMYLFTLGGMAGGCGAFIASAGAFIQALTPHKYLRKTIWFRMIVALVLSVASIYFVYQEPLDLIPITMVIVCRFGELQHKPQRVRIAYFVTCFPWMLYHYINDFYLPLFACIIGAISLFVAIMRHHRPHTEEQPT